MRSFVGIAAHASYTRISSLPVRTFLIEKRDCFALYQLSDCIGDRREKYAASSKLAGWLIIICNLRNPFGNLWKPFGIALKLQCFLQLTSQHPYAEVFIGKPHVFTIDIKNLSLVEETVKEILNTEVSAMTISSDLPRKSSANFRNLWKSSENVRKMFGNVCTTFGLVTFGKSSFTCNFSLQHNTLSSIQVLRLKKIIT